VIWFNIEQQLLKNQRLSVVSRLGTSLIDNRQLTTDNVLSY